jgi:chemotaxis protein methyltransferase CheR
MSSADFDFLRKYLHRMIGIVVEADRNHLIESRLAPVARLRGMASVDELIAEFQCRRDKELWRDIVEAMTTNETYFFRDRTPFRLFREFILPKLLEERRAERQLRIWCAASSTGQEPYSLAMILEEEAERLAGWKVDIVATDVSEAVLEAARRGIYNQFEVQRGLPVSLLLRHFVRQGDNWQLNADIRSRVRFRQLNLLEDFRDIGACDVIFCRNVLIYFDQKTKADVLNRMHRIVRPNGYLLLGAAETVLGITQSWVPHVEHPTLVVPVDANGIAAEGRPALKLVSGL